MILKLAWRNIWRNKTRSLIIIIAIMLGLWAGVFLTGFAWGMYDSRINTLIANESSHLQIHNEQFEIEGMSKYTISSLDEIHAILDSDENVASYTSRMITTAMIASPHTSTGVSLYGVNPDEEQKTTKLADKIIEGSYFQEKGRNQILLSKRTVDKLKVGLNKKVIVTFQDLEGDLVSASFRIKGIFESINQVYDETHAFVQQKDIGPLLKSVDRYQEVAILLDDDRKMDQVQSKLSPIDPKLSVKNWRQLDPLMEYAMDSFDSSMQVVVSIIMLALAFGIINTMLMSIMDRVREIGMLMAIGLNKIKLFLMILFETLFLAIIGAPLGMLLAWITILITGKTGIHLSGLKAGMDSMGFSTTVYPVILPHQFVNIGITVLIVSIVAAIFPIIKALRLKPVEAIRKV